MLEVHKTVIGIDDESQLIKDLQFLKNSFDKFIFQEAL